MRKVEAQLRSEVARLFDEGAIDLFVGYASARVPLKGAACVIRNAAETEQLVWNRTCTSNLAALLPELLRPPVGAKEFTPPRIGILAKGCVSRSLITLIKANQVPRESLVIVGVDCPGMIDRHKVVERVAGDVRSAAWESEDLVVRTLDGEDQNVTVGDVLLDDCRACRYRSAVLSDVFVGKPTEPRTDLPDDPAAALTTLDPGARWERFQSEMSRCIRCYACREACPNCFCTECFADESDPKWIGVTTEQTDVSVFHLGRAFHQAGRCVGCGACVAACPMGIDLRMLYRKVNEDVKNLFGIDVGVSLEEPEPLCQFSLEDDQTFMTEP